jgi:hypothetical protein
MCVTSQNYYQQNFILDFWFQLRSIVLYLQFVGVSRLIQSSSECEWRYYFQLPSHFLQLSLIFIWQFFENNNNPSNKNVPLIFQALFLRKLFFFTGILPFEASRGAKEKSLSENMKKLNSMYKLLYEKYSMVRTSTCWPIPQEEIPGGIHDNPSWVILGISNHGNLILYTTQKKIFCNKRGTIAPQHP